MATKTWTGGNATDANWSRSDNWTPSGAPVAGDALHFAGSTRPSTNNGIAADTSFASITFDSGATNFTLAGNRITCAGTITNSSSNSQTISLAMIFAADRTIACTNRDISISGIISGTGGITKSGSNTLTLSGVNTYTGKTTATGGTLACSIPWTIAGSSGPFGAPTGASATIDLSNGTMLNAVWPQLSGDGTTDRTINLVSNGSGTVTIQANDNDTNFQLGAVTATGTGTKTLALNLGTGNFDRACIAFSGAISDATDASAVSVTVTFYAPSTGLSKMYFSAVNTFSGSLTITNSASPGNAGTVYIGATPNASRNPVIGSGSLNSGNYNGAISIGTDTTLSHFSSATQTLSGIISGAGAVTMNGTDVLTLSGANTYTGKTTISNGTISAASINKVSGGSANSNLGAPVSTANGTIAIGGSANTGTLIYTGTGETTDRVVNLSGTTGGATITQSGSSGALIFSGNVTATVNGAKTLTLQGSAAGTGEIQGTIVNSTGITTVIKDGTGQWTLSGTSSSYTGATSIKNGTLSIASILSVSGGNSSIGAPITTGNGTIAMGVNGAATLVYTGTGGTTDRVINLNSASNGITLDISGASGNLVFSSAPTYTNGAKTITLQGSTSGTGEISSVIANTGSGAISLTKAGTGTWKLSNANTFTGNIAVTGGILTITSTYATTACSISSGAIFNIDTTAGTLDLASITFSGAGTLQKSGANQVLWSTGIATFALGSGSLIDVQGGTFTGSSFGDEVWTNNKSDLNVASGAIFDGVEANAMVNKLTGSGTIKSGYPGAGYIEFTFGVDNGTGGNFSGILADSASAGNFTKIGTGTQTLSGTSANTFTGLTTVTTGRLILSKSVNIAAIGGNLTINGGQVTFVNSGQLVSTCVLNMSVSTSCFNSSDNIGTNRLTLTQTLASITVTDGFFSTGNTSVWTINGAVSFTGGTATIFTGNYGFTMTCTSLTVTGMPNEAGGTVNTANSFTLYGNSTVTQTTIDVSGTTTINNSMICLDLSPVASALGSKIILDGNLTTTGSSPCYIKQSSESGGTIGTTVLELSSTAPGVTRTFTIGSGADLTVGGSLLPITNGSSSAGALTKAGTGTLTIAGANTYTGATTISAGTLLVNGSTSATSAVEVQNTGTLGGTGTVGAAITQDSGSFINPGNGGSNIGTLNTANVTMNASSTYLVDLNGTIPTYDQINSSGTVTCAGTLTINSLSNAASKKTYTIINASTVSSIFSGLSNNTVFFQQSRRFKITYSSTQVILTDVSMQDLFSFTDNDSISATFWTTSS